MIVVRPCRFCGRPTALDELGGVRWYVHVHPVCLGYAAEVEVAAHALARRVRQLLEQANAHGPN